MSAKDFHLERTELERVLSSGIFERSPSLAQLLTYVCGKYFEGDAKNIKEYSIAVDAFGLAAGRIGFVSSNGWDAHGAALFGFRTVWVNRTGLPRERLSGELAAITPDLSSLPDLMVPA